MEFIPENLFDSGIGQEFLVGTIFMPIFKPITDDLGYNQQQAYNYVKTMVCGGSTSVTFNGLKTSYENGELINKPISSEVDVESSGKTLEDYKKKISKLNDKLNNLKDCLTSIITSATSYVAAIAIPFSMAAGIAGILSTVGQLKSLKNIIGEVRDLLEELHLSGDTLDSLVPGAGTSINAVLDLIESVTNTLTAIIP